MRTDIISFACAAAILAACYTAPCHAQAGSSAGQTASSDTSAAVQAASGLDEKIMGPSPQASTFLKYGEYPVSLYTGLVDITIPIYTIEQNGITVPIAFKYHASGLKYDDVSMEVGLGWALMAGGVVTRATRGAEDYSCPRFIKDVDKIETYRGTTITQEYERIRKVANGYFELGDKSLKEDGEIDLWNFSFLNHSGTYCFPPKTSPTQQGGPDYGIFIPNNGMQALAHSRPQLRDTEGITYTFGAFDSEQDPKFCEYFLTEIVSADRADSIRFTYDYVSNKMARPFIQDDLLLTTTYYWRVTMPEIFRTYSGGVFYSYSRPPRLRRIDFRGGHVEFDYKVMNGNNTWDLQTINIYSHLQQEPLQTITLTKGKFKYNQDRLDKVTFSDTKGSSYDYQFGYKGDPHIIESRSLKTGIDYWGYFNGAYQDTFVPHFPEQAIKGMDRTPDVRYMQLGILNKIVYPTKGYTEFEYEAHDVQTQTGSMQIYGGLRIKEIRNYSSEGNLTERKWYEYGDKETKGGISMGYPTIDDFTITTKSLKTIRAQSSDGSLNYPDVKTLTKRYTSLLKRNKLISGSTVVYPKVTEYVGNENGDYGKTEYSYIVFPDQDSPLIGTGHRVNSADMPLRNNSWKTGNLRSKNVFRKEGETYRCISSLYNTYMDINTAEYMNLRVAQYVYISFDLGGDMQEEIVMENYIKYPLFIEEFDPTATNNTPFNYFNYYTTTGLRVLKSSEEMTDGVTKLTEYTYNATGLPASVTETFSTGDRKITHNKFTTDVTGYEAMVEENMLSPLIEQRIYHNDSLTSFDKTIYSNAVSTNMHLYAPRERVVEKYDASGTQTRKITYHKYDRYGNPLSLTRADGLSVVYLWSYASIYPVMQIQNATYEQVVQALGAGTIEALASQYPTAATLQSYATKLQTVLENSLITIHTYKPLVGVTSITDPAGRSTSYEYDGFGRLEKVLDEQGNPLQTFEYNYRK